MVSLVADALSVRLGARPVLTDVTAAFRGGTLVGILGPNGAGKSTFVRALLGLIASTGSVTLDGEPLAALSRSHIARRIAYLPQGQTLHWTLSVERLIALGRLPHLAPFQTLSAEDRAAVTRAMDRAEVAALADRTATDLSGGERARVLLARALAVEAPALIVDEPLASLDPAHQLQGMEILRAEADGGALVIAVLHDLSLAARFCDRLLLLDSGRLVADGPPSAILTEAHLARVYGIAARIDLAHEPPLIVPLTRLPARR